jgi:hypothetical protein
MNSRYRASFPPAAPAHAITIVTDELIRMTVFRVASGTFSTADWSGHDGAPVRSSA